MKRKFIATCKTEPLFLCSPIKSETYSTKFWFLNIGPVGTETLQSFMQLWIFIKDRAFQGWHTCCEMNVDKLKGLAIIYCQGAGGNNGGGGYEKFLMDREWALTPFNLQYHCSIFAAYLQSVLHVHWTDPQCIINLWECVLRAEVSFEVQWSMCEPNISKDMTFQSFSKFLPIFFSTAAFSTSSVDLPSKKSTDPRNVVFLRPPRS